MGTQVHFRDLFFVFVTINKNVLQIDYILVSKAYWHGFPRLAIGFALD